MTKFSPNIFLILALSIQFSSAKIPFNQKDYAIAPGEVIVKLKNVSSNELQKSKSLIISQIQSQYRLQGVQQIFKFETLRKLEHKNDLERIFLYTVASTTNIEALARKISQHSEVEYAEPHYYFRQHVIPNDPLYSQVYPLAIVKADSAWNLQKGDSTVIIGIIDSGVDWDHPDLAQAIWNNKNEIPNNGIDDDANGFIDDIRGWDFVANISGAAVGEDGSVEDNNPMDFDGHGTHVAGIAAGVTNNGIGISALSWGCKIMPLRCGWRSTDGNGYVSSLYAAKAYIYATNNGASVVNQSSGTSNVVIDGARYAFKNGVVITNSAGNSNSDFAASLGSEPWALSVAATNSNDGKASYSSYNKKVDISSPGGDFSSANQKGFLSTVVNPSSFYGNNLYAEFQGTSMASPFVASLVGLIKSKNKNWSPAQIMFQITGTADNIDSKNPQYAGKLGFGRINALRAVTEFPPNPNPDIDFAFYSFSDVAGGNGNGVAEAGENIKIVVTIKNNWGDAQNLSGFLTTTHWAANITKPSASYGLLRGISNLDSNLRGNTNDEFIVSLNANAIPEVIPFKFIVNASNGYTKEFNFELSIGARILLVDDDDGVVNVEHYYTTALKTLGTTYDVWNHTANGTPSLELLQKYSAVFWSCEWSFPSLDSADRSVISAYLNRGGKLFLSGQDIGWDLADAQGTEYEASGGTSKIFFEQYLKAKYISDDAVTGNIKGILNDSIGSGLTFARYQPQRAAGEQYPDVLDTTGGSVYSFQYADGTQANRSAAILFSGNYKLLFFGFGGFESISDSTKRIIVMDRILRWIFEYSIITEKLSNTENTTTPYNIRSSISSKSLLTSVDLIWSSNGVLPYSKIPMTFLNGQYSAAIPAQSSNSIISYFPLAMTINGYLPYDKSSFYVGPDIVKPSITVNDTIANSINLNGPFIFSAAMTDDVGIDTMSASILYRINGGNENTVSMIRTTGNNFTGSIIPNSTLKSGDLVTYYATVTDISQLKNIGRYPLTGLKQFIIGREIVDDFENLQSGKWNLGLWNYTSKQRFRGMYSITDSPDSNYKPNSNRIVTIKSGYNLIPFQSALLTFYQRYNIHTSDTAYVQISNNGSNWSTVRSYTGVNPFWKKENIDLGSFVGGSNSNVMIQMKLISDGDNESDGIYIDELEIITDQFAVTISDNPLNSPVQYSLSQNYPNPFNPITVIQFTIPVGTGVSLKLYDLLGREVALLLNSYIDAGTYVHRFDASHLSSGVYYYRIVADSFSEMKKMILIK